VRSFKHDFDSDEGGDYVNRAIDVLCQDRRLLCFHFLDRFYAERLIRNLFDRVSVIVRSFVVGLDSSILFVNLNEYIKTDISWNI
jgi:hypothetical protein